MSPCTLDELSALCRLLGIPHSGTKDKRVARLLDLISLRQELAGWGEYDGDNRKAHVIAEEVMSRYTRPQLVGMAKRSKVFYSTTKRGIVIALLQWRSACRRQGQEFNRELLEHSNRQLAFSLQVRP